MTQLTKYRNEGKMWIKRSTRLLHPQKRRLTQLKKQRNQKNPRISCQLQRLKNDTVDKADKSKYIQVTDTSNERTQIEKPSEIDIHRGNLIVSVFYVQREILPSVKPYQQHIPHKNNRNKTPVSSVLRKEPIGDTVNPRKLSQEDTVNDP